ncbi:hypothetical protein C8J56DRAFT_937698 [Mycena floridula]|nr:hypothetical protein C8J56DRAFT_937698 [Mycena floridula]
MICEQFSFRLPTGLYCVANRYARNSNTGGAAPEACSLIFAHCTSAHKEQWEVTISRLLGLAEDNVSEAWALDCQSHGDSAILNQNRLNSQNSIGIEEYASMLHWFVESGPVSAGRCIAVGHSSSTTAWVLACSMFELVPLKALVLIEPVLICFPDHQDLIELGEARVKGVSLRRDKWKDVAELSAWMKKRHPWKTWDPRIFDLHLKHGYKTTLDAEGREILTTKCTMVQESRLYTHEPHVAAGQDFGKICSQVPVHVIFAESAEFV